MSGVAFAFEASVDEIIDTVLEWPDSGALWPAWDGVPAVRSRSVVGFSYRLVYQLQPDGLVVVVVAHQRCKPGYWRDRLASS